MFQFTQPKRAATSLSRWAIFNLKSFNSRSPSGLRHSQGYDSTIDTYVSIHAAQAGCDAELYLTLDVAKSFNSRSPSGLRLSLDLSSKLVFSFNSRSPSGLRLYPRALYIGSHTFQFTQPKRAATCIWSAKRNASGTFQFTQPKRAATVAAKIQQKRDSLKG